MNQPGQNKGGTGGREKREIESGTVVVLQMLSREGG